MKRSLLSLVALSSSINLYAQTSEPGNDSYCSVPTDALLPDLISVVPQQLGLQNAHQREILRFSNSIANLGKGMWWLKPEFPGSSDINQVQSAYQLYAATTTLSNKKGPATPDALGKCKKGDFEYHPSHHHWHINNVAEFKVCETGDFLHQKSRETPDKCTPILFGTAASVKVTYCLIDWYKLGENTHTSDATRNFTECATSFQGVSPGWVDQYHQSTPDQQLDITGIPAGEYYVVTTSNHNYIFDESDKSNNTSWLKIQVSRESNGNLKLKELENSCSDKTYYDRLKIAINNFTTNSTLRESILKEMCGGMTSNK